ncbi:hypothetical protein [Floridanema evergladense]|uniref:DUF2135 domain-containing protein n=1 Tax=Floridaenema evergladense BLCC-F167 TaxID=3153639 RepID=A0ABV4WL84_9CYAN
MQIRTLSLLVFLGLAGSFYTAESAIAPLAAQAYTSRVNITLERQPNESFQTLTRRAETIARAAAQRSFDNDILVTQAAVVVTGEHIGLSAPILTLEVSRENWKNYPNAQRWSTYYPNSKALLRIDDPTPVVATPAAGERPEPTLGTGVIQTTLRWSTKDDLDLAVTDPSGQTVFYRNKKVASGGQLDVDSNAGCQNTITNPVENVFWPSTGAPPGNYLVRVNLYQRCATQTGQIPFRLRLLVQGRTQELTGNVDDSKKIVNFPLALNAGGATPGQSPANSQNNTPTGTGNPRQRPTSGTNNNSTGSATQQRNSTNPANRSQTNNQNQTGTSTSPNRQTNTPANRSQTNNQNQTGTSTSPNRQTNTPANRSQTNNQNQTGTSTSPNQQTNTQPNRSPSRATSNEGILRRARELRDDLNNRPPTDLPQN